MKMQFTPNDVLALLTAHPETLLELREKASKQVADAIARKEFDPKIDAAIERAERHLFNVISKAVTNGEIYKPTLNANGQKLVQEAIEKQVIAQSLKERRAQMHSDVTKMVEDIMPDLVERMIVAITPRMDDLVRAALGRVIGGVA